MKIDWMVAATIAAPVLAAALAAYLTRLLENRPKLVTYYGNVSAFKIATENGPVAIFTHDIVVRNGGRRAAKNVRLGHNVLPKDVQITPAVEHHVQQVAQGSGTEIVLPTLVPGEQVTISYVYFPPLTYNGVNTYVKSDEGFARVITMLPQPQYPTWASALMGLFCLFGVISALYLLLVGLLRLAR